MTEKSRSGSRKRNLLARRFVDLGRVQAGVRVELKYSQILLLLVGTLLVTLLLIDYDFFSVPDYQVGSIADRTIQAPQDFTLIDQAATDLKREESVQLVPFVFSYDYLVTAERISEFRKGFADARALISEFRKKSGIAEPDALRAGALRDLKVAIQEKLPKFDTGRVLDILLKYQFSEELEGQLVQLLSVSMEYPGVLQRRDQLVHLQERGITIHNVVTGDHEIVSDWTSLRDIQQAKNVLRQNEYVLTVVDGSEKKELLDFLEGWIVHNTFFDEQRTDANEQEAMARVLPVVIQVKKGKTIVRDGDDITEQVFLQLDALKQLGEGESWIGRVVGVFLVVGFFVLVLWMHFQIHQEDLKRKRADFLLSMLVMLFSLLVTRAVLALGDVVAGSLTQETLKNPVHFYFYAPVALGAILTILLLGVSPAIFFALAFALFVGLSTGELSFLLYTLTGSITAVYALRQYRERSAIVRAGVIIGAVNVLMALALQLYLSEGEFQWTQFLVRAMGGLVSGLSSAMLASLFLPVLESLFGLTTDIRLLELSNLNSPILRRLALEAPGSYHHSITVGTLAEAGAEEIGANGLLARVGAYYHDIGKLKHPEYYIENQVFAGNKHETLTPNMSTLILASHVKDGLAIAEEVGLGPKVRDLIPQHHGTRIMTYFYQKAKDAAEEKDAEISENDFRYPGPKPQFREAAILMLADQVEAAARTLQDPSPGQIRSLITRLTQLTIQDGQLDECNITLKELSRVGGAFERVLTGMYHHRIDYPGFEFNKRIEEERPENQRIQ